MPARRTDSKPIGTATTIAKIALPKTATRNGTPQLMAMRLVS
jgi:hypothetical protein